jgi:hypothetical protein
MVFAGNDDTRRAVSRRTCLHRLTRAGSVGETDKEKAAAFCGRLFAAIHEMQLFERGVVYKFDLARAGG